MRRMMKRQRQALRATSGVLMMGLVGLCAACGDDPAPTPGAIEPAPLPNPQVPGYSFPETESAIYGWVEDDDASSVALHAWGLWTALTAETQQVVDGQNLRVFETWLTPADIISDAEDAARNLRPSATLNQHSTSSTAVDARVTGFVKYDPSAADFAQTNALFSKAALNQLLLDGARDIPAFPNTAVTLKPVFMKLSKSEGQYHQLPAWPGPPDPATAFPPADWGQCIWIDLNDSGAGPAQSAVDTSCTDGSRSDSTTYGLGRFVSYVDGDTVYVLKAMHVTTKETTRWTWQTFWWTPNPDAPQAPSSASVAAARPSQLTGAPANYAHCSSYQMVTPVQPETGGMNAGQPVYCYNPWLEAEFGPSQLPNSTPLAGQANEVGVQTNCMSCHAYASWSKDNAENTQDTFYTGDRYVDLQSTDFDGLLRLDFAWSIQQNAE